MQPVSSRAPSSSTTIASDMVRVAIDVGPLHGHRTGIGNAVAWVLDELEDRPELTLLPYVTSTRARLAPPQRRLPVPAALAQRAWSRSRRPAMDRWLGHPDVVHGTNYVVPPTRCPDVVSVYDCWFLEHPELASATVRRAAAVLRRAVDGGAHVLTSSEATAARARELLGTTRVRSVHLGPPPPATCSPPATSTGRALVERLTGWRFVLALGTVERRKNLPTLVSAFERLAEDVPDVVLVIAGRSGDSGDELTRRVGRLAPANARRVIRAEDVDHGSKSWLLRHAAALAYPSLDEGFGFPILEAQQAGTPVVASNAGSIPEVAGAGALLGRAGDAETLAANLHAVLTDGAACAALVDRGRSNVARFDWRVTGDEYVALYRELERARR